MKLGPAEAMDGLMPFLKEFQQVKLGVLGVPEFIKNGSLRMLEALVDSTFQFVNQPTLPSQDQTRCLGHSNQLYHHWGGQAAYGLKAKACFMPSISPKILAIIPSPFAIRTAMLSLRLSRLKAEEEARFLPAVEGDSLAILAAYILNQLRFGKVNKYSSNTNVFEHSGRCFSITENHIPQEIDMSSLDTLGNWDVNGEWNRTFTAHPKKAPGTGELVITGADVVKPFLVLGVISALPMYGSLVKFSFGEVDKISGRQKLIKVEHHQLGENQFCTGSAFVPRPGGSEEDDGWIISYVHNEETNISQVHIIATKRFESKAVAKITLPQRVPYGFHGTFIKTPT
ncbi:hypothetical protein J5N97_004430 [Dioscorea zingiberensis]|uniref:Uncharacterized protein n=1 Tax=Dioscorea zingiberensis TaxID=325984 RepID=A0A9D5HRH7_9LILI|nr:hypothetical protein J5N97_004430 [Dioscorea zingiberensis]